MNRKHPQDFCESWYFCGCLNCERFDEFLNAFSSCGIRKKFGYHIIMTDICAYYRKYMNRNKPIFLSKFCDSENHRNRSIPKYSDDLQRSQDIITDMISSRNIYDRSDVRGRTIDDDIDHDAESSENGRDLENDGWNLDGTIEFCIRCHTTISCSELFIIDLL